MRNIILFAFIFIAACASPQKPSKDSETAASNKPVETAPNPITTAPKASTNKMQGCFNQGGRWAGTLAEGKGRAWYCRAPDALKKCTDSNDCSSKFCVAAKATCKDKTFLQPREKSYPDDCTFEGACHSELDVPKGCSAYLINSKYVYKCLN